MRKYCIIFKYSTVKKKISPFLPTVPTFAVRETDVPRYNEGTSGTPLKPLIDDSALRPLSSLRVQVSFSSSVSRTANVGTVGKNRLQKRNGGQKWVNCLGVEFRDEVNHVL